MVKHLPTMWATQVRSLGGEDPLEKEMATHSSIHYCLENPIGCRSELTSGRRKCSWVNVQTCTVHIDKNILSGSQERSVHNLTVQRAKIIRLELKKKKQLNVT